MTRARAEIELVPTLTTGVAMDEESTRERHGRMPTYFPGRWVQEASNPELQEGREDIRESHGIGA